MDIDKHFVKLFDLIADECHNIVQHYLSCVDVLDTMSRVKSGKKHGYGLIYSDNYIYVTIRLYTMLALLFISIFIHGYSTYDIKNICNSATCLV